MKWRLVAASILVALFGVSTARADDTSGLEGLLAEEVVRRGYVERVGRETVRIVLQHHGLKPWREKNVVRSSSG